MNLIGISVILMSALSLYVAFYYFWMYIKRREDTENLAFALTCFTIALYNIMSSGMYQVSSVEDALIWQKMRLATAALFCISISWFIYYFTDQPGKKPFIIISALMGIFVIPVFLPYGSLTLSTVNPDIMRITVGEIIDMTYYRSDPGLIYQAQYSAMLVIALYLFYLIASYYRSGSTGEARPILMAMICFLCASINDIFISLGLYRFIYLVEFAFTFILLSMNHMLQNSLIDLRNEVEELNELLEDKVNDRVLDLFMSEIGTKVYIDKINDFSSIHNETASTEAIQNLMDSHKASTIMNLSQEISMMTNIDRLLDRVAHKIMEISNAQNCCLFFSSEKNGLSQRISINDLNPGIEECDRELIDSAFRDGTYIISETQKSGKSGADGQGPAPQKRYAAAIPFHLKEKIIGICYLENILSRNVFSTNEIELLEGFLAQLAVPIHNAFTSQAILNGQQFKRKRSISPITEEKLKKAITYISSNYHYEISREGLAASLNMHPDSLGRYFKIYTGKKINEFINEIRINEAAEKLRSSSDSIIDIAYSTGFESMTTFNRIFKKLQKTSPTAYREKNRP